MILNFDISLSSFRVNDCFLVFNQLATGAVESLSLNICLCDNHNNYKHDKVDHNKGNRNKDIQDLEKKKKKIVLFCGFI